MRLLLTRSVLIAILYMLSPLLFSGEAKDVRRYPQWDGRESVEAYAKRAGLPATKVLTLEEGVKLRMVLIPAGSFTMGSPEPESPMVGRGIAIASGVLLLLVVIFFFVRAWQEKPFPKHLYIVIFFVLLISGLGLWGGTRAYEAAKGPVGEQNERPAFEVKFTKPFYLGKFPITQMQYSAIIGSNPSRFQGHDHPVDSVSWNEAQIFCEKLSKAAMVSARLPTEPEWEYACRAGTTTKYYSGDAKSDLDRVAWYFDNSDKTTHPVGKKDPNAFGLYDMLGNVWQWCQDDYKLYPGKPVTDPIPSTKGNMRMLRGGSWNNTADKCRSAYRFRINPQERYISIGLRVVVEVE